MARPSVIPFWTDGDAAKQIQPPAGQINTGWTNGQKPPFRFMNWLFYQIGLWIQYLDSVAASAQVIVAADGSVTGASPNRTYVMNPTTGGVTFTVPAAATIGAGYRFTIKNNNVSSGFNVSFAAFNGTDTLEQEAITLAALGNLEVFTIESDGVSNYIIVG